MDHFLMTRTPLPSSSSSSSLLVGGLGDGIRGFLRRRHVLRDVHFRTARLRRWLVGDDHR